MSINLSPASGTRDFLPEDYSFREKIFQDIKQSFESFGFTGIQTPSFERIEMLEGKYGEEGDKLIFKILKRGEKQTTGEVDFALRYDLTVPALRFYCKNNHLFPKIFKRYQIGPVWRADRPGKGRYREFYQCDIDIFGSPSITADTEIIFVFIHILKKLGLKNFTVRFNSRKIIQAMMLHYNINDDFQKDVITALDKLDKIGKEGVIDEIKKIGLESKAQENLCKAILNHNFTSYIKKEFSKNESYKETLSEIDFIQSTLNDSEQSYKVSFDPLLARGLDYYTGTIFEIFTEDAKGAIAAGGRYDNLSSLFMKKSVPICGGSLGIERILLLLEEQKKKEIFSFGAKVYITNWDSSFTDFSFNLLKKLQDIGISSEVDVSHSKIGKQFKIASERGCEWAIVVGPDERDKQELSIKNLKSGAQEVLPLKNLEERFKKI